VTGHTARITTTYSWGILKIYLSHLRRQYILINYYYAQMSFYKKYLVILRKIYFFNRRDSTYCSHYNYVQLRFPENLLSYSWETTYYYYVLLLCTVDFSENILSYSEETVHSARVTTMYRCFFLEMFLVIPWKQNVLLTLLLCTADFLWKCSYLFRGDSTYCSH